MTFIRGIQLILASLLFSLSVEAKEAMQVRLVKSGQSQLSQMQKEYDQSLIEEEFHKERISRFLNMEQMQIVRGSLKEVKRQDGCVRYQFRVKAVSESKQYIVRSQASICATEVQIYPHFENQSEWILDLEKQLRTTASL